MEPQFEKDVCDHIISPLKGVVRRFCNEGNDILSVADVREVRWPIEDTLLTFSYRAIN